MKKERADVLAFKQGLFTSREKAKSAIMAGLLYVDEVKVLKPGDMFDVETVFLSRGLEQPYVSRGGLKLEKAIEYFKIDLENSTCGDFGASTGGFTDCMLQNGAKKVYAIDVGYGQLDWKIRSDPKVVVIERTNIRTMTDDLIDEELDFISIDVSFISLTLILPKAIANLNNTGEIVALIKPQFEAGREQVGKKGIVKSREVHVEVIEKIRDFLEDNNMKMANLTYSPITGTTGNIEYLAHIKREDSIETLYDITTIVNEAFNQLR